MPIGFAGNEGIVGGSPEQSGGIGGFAYDQFKYFSWRSPTYTARAATRGFSGKKQSIARLMGEEAFGMKPDLLLARKMTGTTFLGRGYSAAMSRAPESWRAFAPTLAHLSPSRHLTMMNLYTGGSAEGVTRGVGKYGVSVADMMANVGRFENPVQGAEGIKGMLRGNIGKILGNDVAAEYGFDALAEQSRAASLGADLRNTQRASKGAWAAGDTAGIKTGIRNSSQILMGTEKAGADMLNKKLAMKLVESAGGRAALRLGTMAAVSWIPIAGQVIDIAMLASMGVDAVKWGTKAAYKGLMNVGGMIGEDWKRGMFQTSSVSPFVGSTQRQRALQVMQQTGLNLSSALGNEAQYF